MNDVVDPPDTDEPPSENVAVDKPRKLPSPKKMLLGAMIFPLFMMFVMPLLYSWGLHSPSPHDMKVAVIGEGAQSQQLANALTTSADGKFIVSTVSSQEAAAEQIEKLNLRGAWDPSTGNLLIANAGGMAASNAAQGFLSAVAQQQNPSTPVNVIDVVAPTDNDKLANTVMFVGLGAILAGFSMATVLRMGLNGLSLRVESAILIIGGLFTSLIPMFIAYSVYGTFDSGFFKAFLLVYAGVLTVSFFHLGNMRLIGPVAIVPTIVIMVLLGIPASGAAVPAEMVPAALGTLNRILPTPALLDGLKRVIYFPDASVGATLSTLALWIALGFIMVGLAALKHTNAPALEHRGFRQFFGDSHTVSGEQMERRKTLAGSMVMPVFMATVMPLVFIGLFHNPTPHEMKVAVVGTDRAAAEQVIGQLEKVTADQFDFSIVDDQAAAKDQIERQDLRGAYDPTTGTLTVANAGNMQATMAVEQLFHGVAAGSDKELKVDDIAPLPTSDLMGVGVLYIGIGAILGGFLAAVVAFMLGRGVSSGFQLLTILGVCVITAGTQVLVSYQWLGILHDNEAKVFGLLLLISVTCALFQYGGSLLIGPAMLLVSLLVLTFLGVATSGVAVGMDMAGPFYRGLAPILPTSNGFVGLKQLAYFDGVGLWSSLWVVLVWAGAGVLATGVGLWLRKIGKGAQPPPMNMLPEG